MCFHNMWFRSSGKSPLALRMQVFLVGDLTGLYNISLEVESVGGATKVPYKAALGNFLHMHNLNQNFSLGNVFPVFDITFCFKLFMWRKSADTLL